MADTTLTHKVRNPKKLTNWLTIWTATVANATDENAYTITPSQNWNIPVTNINGISNDGDNTKFLNQTGQWTEPVDKDTTYTAGTGLKLNGTTFNHHNKVTAGTAGTSDATNGKTLDVPYIIYDAQGHITGSGTHEHTVNGFLTDSSPLNGSNISSGSISSSFLPKNEVNSDGIVKGPTVSDTYKVWGTDNWGNPQWKSISNSDLPDILASKLPSNTTTTDGIVSKPSTGAKNRVWGINNDNPAATGWYDIYYEYPILTSKDITYESNTEDFGGLLTIPSSVVIGCTWGDTTAGIGARKQFSNT